MDLLPPTQLALRYYGINDIRLDPAVPLRAPNPEEVVVEIAFTGLCGSDLHTISGGPRRKTRDGFPLVRVEDGPHTMGHEISGIIVVLGSQVEQEGKFKVGDRVTSESIYYCGECGACEKGLTNLCAKLAVLGTGQGGGLAKYCNVRAQLVHKIPDNVSLKDASITDVAGTAWHAVVNVGKPKQGDTALVIGAGAVGLCVMKVLQASGVSSVYMSEPSAVRAASGVKFGATRVFDPRKEDVVRLCIEATGGEGVDAVYDCAGVQPGLDAACQIVRVGGKIVNVALWEHPAQFHPTTMLVRGFTYEGSLAYTPGVFAEVLQAISAGKINLDGLFTANPKLLDVIEEGFGALRSHGEEHIKIVVSP